jgi:hypothetical protein
MLKVWLHVYRDSLSGFWVIMQASNEKKEFLDNREKAMVRIIEMAGYSQDCWFFKGILQKLSESYEKEKHFVIGPVEFEQIIKPEIEKFFKEKRRWA